ncbi:hypothetical protein HOC13_01155 [Candidatus Woesearchaeota archaeon]|jgi:glycerophosphoryl diester phosphodiesterase|nr:hypothetical protein [Candidatus Woesearchaeota archaeon]
MGKILNIAHRGYSSVAPENTKKSFLEAVKLGVDMIELDVQKTKDNVVVAIHDSEMGRTSNGSGKIEEMSWAELKKHDFGSGEKILTLEEALKVINNRCGVIVELKDSLKGNEALVLNELKGLERKVWIHSGNWKILKNFKRLNDGVKSGYVLEFSFWRLLFAYLFIKKKVDFFSVSYEFFNKIWMIRLVMKLGVPIYVWTVNEYEKIKGLLSYNVAGIISNHPERVKEILSKRR